MSESDHVTSHLPTHSAVRPAGQAKKSTKPTHTKEEKDVAALTGDRLGRVQVEADAAGDHLAGQVDAAVQLDDELAVCHAAAKEQKPSTSMQPSHWPAVTSPKAVSGIPQPINLPAGPNRLGIHEGYCGSNTNTKTT